MIIICALSIALAFDNDKSPSFDADVKPILREHCFKCHGDDTQKADLNLQSYQALLKGGSGGEVVAAGRPGASALYQAVAHEGEAAPMPPNRPRISDAQVATVRHWIEQGVRESAGGAAVERPKAAEFRPMAVADRSLAGPGPMPEGLTALDPPSSRRPHPVTSLAASPRSPLLAVAGDERIMLIHLDTHAPIGALAFPEGTPFVLRFSRDGSVLLAAGGRPASAGKAVLFDVKSGRRLAEIGDELDAVIAADLSPDQKRLALGGPGRVVKVYSTSDGQLVYRIDKHNDWITAIEFSPDGTRLATADRTGAVHLWEASSGGILLSLMEHKDSVTALSWRGDGASLATGGEDGKLILWDIPGGWPTATLAAPHAPKASPRSPGKRPGGVLTARYALDGRLLTAGRDRSVRVWSPAGQPLARFESPDALPLKVDSGGNTLVVGDALGVLHYWRLPDGPAGK